VLGQRWTSRGGQPVERTIAHGSNPTQRTRAVHPVAERAYQCSFDRKGKSRSIPSHYLQGTQGLTVKQHAFYLLIATPSCQQQHCIRENASLHSCPYSASAEAICLEGSSSQHFGCAARLVSKFRKGSQHALQGYSTDPGLPR